jgi:hypothetical protein
MLTDFSSNLDPASPPSSWSVFLSHQLAGDLMH